jgi:hypothetical protein
VEAAAIHPQERFLDAATAAAVVAVAAVVTTAAVAVAGVAIPAAVELAAVVAAAGAPLTLRRPHPAFTYGAAGKTRPVTASS